MRRTFTLLAVVLSLAADWPQFRGPHGDGRADVGSPPVAWSETDNVRWKTAIHGKAWSSPVVIGNEIWLTSATDTGTELFALCVDRATGKITQDLKLATVEKPQFCHNYNSYASPTPVAEPGRLYVHFGSPYTACIDTKTGKPIWERRDLPCNHWRGAGSSPVIHDNLIILTFDGYDQQYLAALDKNTGATVWRTEREIHYSSDDGDIKKAYATPAVLLVDGKAQIVSPAAEATIAYDATNGKEVWRVTHGGMNAASRPVVGKGLVFLTSGHTKYLLAVPQGAKGDLTKQIVWKTAKGAPSRPSLLMHEDWIFTINDEGIVSCIEAKTGNRIWQERLGGAFSASPVLADGKLYLVGEAGKSFVLKAGPKFEQLAVNTLDAGCMASPAVVDDTLIIRTKTHLYSVGK